MPNWRINALLRKSFFGDVTKLVSGTLGGRLIYLAAMPFATRLYSPEDFALLAVYVGIVSTISVAACLRFEIAIPLANSDAAAAQLLALSLSSAVVVTVLTLVLTFAAPDQILGSLEQLKLAGLFWVVPFGVAVSAGYSALQFWTIRAKRFGRIARARILQSALSAGAILGLGWVGFTPFGLLLGNMIAMGAGVVWLGIEALSRDASLLRIASWRGMSTAFRIYSRYPMYSAPESFANMAGTQLPVILIATSIGGEAGFLFLAMQVMVLPMSLLGSSISQVYVSRIQEEMSNGRLSTFTLSIMKRLALIGGGPLVIIGLLAPFVFPIIFGSEWARTGEIVSWMVPWILLQFIVSPVSMSLHITGNQPLAFGLQLTGLILRVGVVVYAQAYSPTIAIQMFCLASALFYLFYSICVVLVVSRH